MSHPHALIAGGNGFIGRNLSLYLLNKGYQVTVVDSNITSAPGAAEAWIAQQIGGRFSKTQFHVIEADIIDLAQPQVRARLFQALDRAGVPTELYNMASPASPVDFSRLPDYILQTAAVGHRHLLMLAKEWNIPVLFASSSEVYGDSQVHPQPESYFGNVNQIGHRSCYDEAKRYGEALSYAWKRQFNVDVRIARIFNTYGPGMRLDDGRVIPNFFVQSLQKESLSINGDGQQTRSFCFVSDLVEGLYLLMQSGENQPVNIGSTFEFTVLDVAKMINSLTGNTQPIRHQPLPENDPKIRQPDLARARSLLGWSPKVDIKDGLVRSLDYFKSEMARRQAYVQTPTVHPS